MEAGSRKNVLVLCLHDFTDFWYGWRNQLKELSESFWVVALDLKADMYAMFDDIWPHSDKVLTCASSWQKASIKDLCKLNYLFCEYLSNIVKHCYYMSVWRASGTQRSRTWPATTQTRSSSRSCGSSWRLCRSGRGRSWWWVTASAASWAGSWPRATPTSWPSSCRCPRRTRGSGSPTSWGPGPASCRWAVIGGAWSRDPVLLSDWCRTGGCTSAGCPSSRSCRWWTTTSRCSTRGSGSGTAPPTSPTIPTLTKYGVYFLRNSSLHIHIDN